MSKFPQARQAKTFTPAWMRSARAWYGSAFEPKKKGDLAEAMADWTEMDPAERGFVLAHLQYLGLQAQLGTQKMLRELRVLFEEVGDEVIEAIEAGFEDSEDLEDLEDPEGGAGDEDGDAADEDGGDYEEVDEPDEVDEPEQVVTGRPTLVAVPDPVLGALPVAEAVESVTDDGGAEAGFDEPEGA